MQECYLENDVLSRRYVDSTPSINRIPICHSRIQLRNPLALTPYTVLVQTSVSLPDSSIVVLSMRGGSEGR